MTVCWGWPECRCQNDLIMLLCSALGSGSSSSSFRLLFSCCETAKFNNYLPRSFPLHLNDTVTTWKFFVFQWLDIHIICTARQRQRTAGSARTIRRSRSYIGDTRLSETCKVCVQQHLYDNAQCDLNKHECIVCSAIQFVQQSSV